MGLAGRCQALFEVHARGGQLVVWARGALLPSGHRESRGPRDLALGCRARRSRAWGSQRERIGWERLSERGGITARGAQSEGFFQKPKGRSRAFISAVAGYQSLKDGRAGNPTHVTGGRMRARRSFVSRELPTVTGRSAVAAFRTGLSPMSRFRVPAWPGRCA